MPGPTVVVIKVHFELNTPDGLRRVLFGLEKDTKEELVVWTINFQLFERKAKTDQFGDAIVKFDVEVDKKLTANAEATAKKSKLTAPQTAHLLGAAANDAKKAKAKKIPQAQADMTVQNTFKK